MVFQNYALYPHMTVRKNLAFGLKVRKTPGAEIDRRVGDVAKSSGSSRSSTASRNLSGGQRQRVAMGRAIVREPAAFLMDEPLSNLDAKLRVGMRAELSRLHDRLGTTTVYVTHDQIEAMTLGQRVAVMKDGVIQQVGEPQVLYREPANLFVAAFIGSPSMNLVEATVAGGIVEFAGFRLELAPDCRPLATAPSFSASGRAISRTRTTPTRGLPEIEVEVAVLEELGAESHVIFWVDATRVEAEDLEAAADEEETHSCSRTTSAPSSPRRSTLDDRPAGRAVAACGRPPRVPLLRSEHRRDAADARGRARGRAGLEVRCVVKERGRPGPQQGSGVRRGRRQGRRPWRRPRRTRAAACRPA